MARISDIICGSGGKARNLETTTLNRAPYTDRTAGLPSRLIELVDGTQYYVPTLDYYGVGQGKEIAVDDFTEETGWDAVANIGYTSTYALPVQLTDGRDCLLTYNYVGASERNFYLVDTAWPGADVSSLSVTTASTASIGRHGLVPLLWTASYLYFAAIDSQTTTDVIATYLLRLTLSDGTITELANAEHASNGVPLATNYCTLLPGGDEDLVQIVHYETQTDETMDVCVVSYDINSTTATITRTDGLDLTTIDTIGAVSNRFTEPVVIGSDGEAYGVISSSTGIIIAHIEVASNGVATLGTNGWFETVADIADTNTGWLIKDLLIADEYTKVFWSADDTYVLHMDVDFVGQSITFNASSVTGYGPSQSMIAPQTIVMGRVLVAAVASTNTGARALRVDQDISLPANHWMTTDVILFPSPNNYNNDTGRVQYRPHQPDIYAPFGQFAIVNDGFDDATMIDAFLGMFSPWGVYRYGMSKLTCEENDHVELESQVACAFSIDATTCSVDKKLSIGATGSASSGMSVIDVGSREYLARDVVDSREEAGSGLIEGYNLSSVAQVAVSMAADRGCGLPRKNSRTLLRAINSTLRYNDVGNNPVSEESTNYVIIETLQCY